ncbi:MAG TPA: GNAT family protein [Pyrinomonadaceae bacterium]|nr:GNAT family protein [Pyrinomonadaceae bacterium]
MDIKPITLEGRYVRLEPLSINHLDALCEVGLDEDLWRWTTTRINTPEEMRRYVETALEEQARGVALPFVTVEKSSGRVIGSTRFAAIERTHRRVEIGFTWVARDWQRTPVNTEAKYLMLRHAFETLGTIRVEFKANSLNERSRRAILRIGAIEEGTLRNHMINATGSIRHSVYFSIIDSEWPALKSALEAKLSRPFSPSPARS